MADNNQFWTARMASEYRKPTYIAEFGPEFTSQDSLAAEDPTGLGLHNGIWASVVMGAANTAMTW